MEFLNSLSRAVAIFIGGICAHCERIGITSPLLIAYPYLLPNLIIAGFTCLSLVLLLLFVDETLKQPEEEKRQTQEAKMSWMGLLGYNKVWLVISIFSFLTFTITSMSLIWVLWLYIDLNWNTFEISLITGIPAFIIILFSPVYYDTMINKCGYNKTIRYGFAISLPVILVIPYILYLPMNSISLFCLTSTLLLFWYMAMY